MNIKFIKLIIILLLTSAIVACGSRAKLSQQGERVTIVEKEPLQCKELGKFFGAGTQFKYALNNLKNIVGERGGNYVYIVNAQRIRGKGTTFVVGNDNSVYGYGFKCKK